MEDAPEWRTPDRVLHYLLKRSKIAPDSRSHS
jgi:hypothetical protein